VCDLKRGSTIIYNAFFTFAQHDLCTHKGQLLNFFVFSESSDVASLQESMGRCSVVQLTKSLLMPQDNAKYFSDKIQCLNYV
jgi:hypothetical protein